MGVEKGVSDFDLIPLQKSQFKAFLLYSLKLQLTIERVFVDGIYG